MNIPAGRVADRVAQRKTKRDAQGTGQALAWELSVLEKIDLILLSVLCEGVIVALIMFPSKSRSRTEGT